MNRIDRLFAIQTFLQSRRFVPAEAIADKFGISVRTVYRDIKALGESGVPVSFEPAKGYFIVNGYFLRPVSFTTEEAAALILMEGATMVFADRSIAELYAAALTKIRSVLRSSQKAGIEAISNSMGIQLPACMEAGYAHLATLQAGIAGKFILELAYRNKAGEASFRRVEAIGLQYYAMAWHLLAWCHHRKAYRDFRVSRITSVRCTHEPFTINDHCTLEELQAQLPVDF